MHVRHRFIAFGLAAALALAGGGCSSAPSDAAPTTLAPTTSTVVQCTTARDIAAVLSTTDFSDPAGLEALPDTVRELSTVVPAELTADVETLAAALDDFVALLREFDFDLTTIDNDPDAQARLGEMNDPSVTEATQRIQDWLDATCAGS